MVVASMAPLNGVGFLRITTLTPSFSRQTTSWPSGVIAPQQHLFDLVFGDSVLYHALLRMSGQCNVAKPRHVGEVVLHGAILHSLASTSRLPLAERIQYPNG